MRRAFEIALQKQGAVGSNPVVGCVIVYHNKIIGEGRHEYYGGPHAEVNAISSVMDNHIDLLHKASLYVTLEPCFHFGKTPPCVNLILKYNIPKVYISCIDPNPKVTMKSVNRLRESGHEVTVGILKEEGKEVAKKYFTFTEKKRPYIILKYAQSQDRFIGKFGESIWLTNPISKKLVHKWRSEESAILIGTATAKQDNPKLTNRLWTGNNPVRIVLDQHCKLNKSLHLFDESTPTLVFHDQQFDMNKENTAIQYHRIPFDKSLISNILKELHRQKLKSLIVEGGAKTLQSFIDANLWDEARVFTAKKILGSGISAPKHKGAITSKISIQEDQLTTFRNYMSE